MNIYDLQKIKKLKATARRTIYILDCLVQGMTASQIRAKRPEIERGLIHYYIQAIKKTEEIQNV